MTWAFNPSDKSAGLSLSGANLVATGTSSSDGVRGTVSASSGKYYWEAVVTNYGNTFNCAFGIGNAACTLTGWMGDTSVDGVVQYVHNTGWDQNGGTYGSTPTFATGDRLGFAWDADAERIWVTKDGTTWYGQTSAGDPAAGTNGFDYSPLDAGPYFPIFQTGNGDIFTIYPDAGSWARTPPSGFGELGAPSGGGDITGTLAVTEGADGSAFVGEVEQDWDFLGVSDVVTVTTTGHTLVTTGLPTLQQNDLLIACIGSRIASATPITLPSGGEWNLIGQQNNNNILTTTGAIASGTMAYCKRGASNPNFAFTHPVAAAPAMGRIIAYRPRGEWTLDTFAANTTATNTTSVSTAGLTTAQANELLVRMAVGGQEAAWSAFDAATDPTTSSGTNSAQTADPIAGTWQERADSSTTTSNDMSLAIADAIRATAGATGNLTATASLGAGHVQITAAFRLVDRTGTMAVTEGADAASMSGTVEQGRTGTMAVTEGADVAAASGLVRIAGALAATEGADGVAFAGLVRVTGTFAAIEGADSAAMSGTVSSGRTGTLAVVEGADGAAFAGDVDVRGTMAATEGADVFAGAGTVATNRTGTLAATEGADSAAAAGLVRIAGTMAATEGADGTTATGLVRITGTLAVTDRPDVAAIIGTLTNSRTGTMAATEGADSAAATGTVRVSGTLAATDRPDVAAASGLVRVTGTLSVTDGADTAAAAGSIATNRTGTLAAVEGADLLAAVGRVIGTGTILVTEGADIASFVGSVRVSGIVNATEGADLLAATGKVLQSTGPRHVEQAALMI